MELFPFQIEASTQIADRFIAYYPNSLMIDRNTPVPFYQNLSSLTGSGKTLILADAVTQIRSQLANEPVVLWLSMGKVVVWQTYANLSSGKYADLVSGFTVKPLLDCQQSDIEHPKGGLILIATVGKFNQRSKEEGDRKIYQVLLDKENTSLWEMLKERRDSNRRRRPLIIVYDEGHNLSNQQIDILLELAPDALIAASATMKVPSALSPTINRLRHDKKWADDNFTTIVRSKDVVNSGLVKQQILLGGYVTPMEIAIDEMIESMHRAEVSAADLGLPFKPKAIYVSNTNIVSGVIDNISYPFKDRQARPIQIWRHLVENCKVDPSTIAVYSNLKFDAKFPPPPNFNLFAGGDSDYDNFVAGNYQHIIFNLTLQEGWDDPACYFAYIDKDMGSRIQVTQIIGRVLRQPQAQHYSDPSLNTAHFFIRTDEKSVFETVLQDVQQKVTTENPDITLTVFSGQKGSVSKISLEPRRERQLPEVNIDASKAKEVIQGIHAKIQDFRDGGVNTIGKGNRIQVRQLIGSSGEQQEEWVELEHSNKVMARWIFAREIQKAYPKALNVCDVEDPKLDALVEYSSLAADHIRESAQKVVEAYLVHSRVVHSILNATDVPPVNVDPEKMERFKFSVHEGYGDLNGFEKEFAEALDKTQRVWLRNPSRGLFEIPLLTNGRSRNFNPDFIVWIDKAVVAIDTKGDHLIKEAAGERLFFIDKLGSGPDVLIRLVTRGKWDSNIRSLGGDGYTVWGLRMGKPHGIYASNIGEAVKLCLRQDL